MSVLKKLTSSFTEYNEQITIKDGDVNTIEVNQTELGKKTIIKLDPTFAYIKLNLNSTEVLDLEKRNDDCNTLPFLHSGADYNVQVPVIINLKSRTAKRIVDLDERKHFLNTNKDRCCIHHNSEQNPVPMSGNGRGVYALDCISYISILEYNNSDNAVFTFIRSGLRFVNSKTPKVFYEKNNVYCLSIRNDGKSSLTKNRKLCMSRIDIGDALILIIDILRSHSQDNQPLYKIVADLFFNYFFHNRPFSRQELSELTLESLSAMYMLQRNRKLFQLPWRDSDLANIYAYNRTVVALNYRLNSLLQQEKETICARRSINRYLRLGNTKKAVDACFYGYKFPKSIRKLLLKMPPLFVSKSSYYEIYNAIQDHGVDKVRTIISTKDSQPRVDIINRCRFKVLLDLGFCAKRIANHDLVILNDILSMRNRLSMYDLEVEFTSNIDEYHDRLQIANEEVSLRIRNENQAEVNEAFKLRAYKENKINELFEITDTSSLRPKQIIDGLIFRSPKTPFELQSVGRKLKICVESYAQHFFLERLELVLLTKQNANHQEEYVGCLEIVDNKLVQAKLSCNRVVISDGSVFKAVTAWLKHQNIQSYTYDMGVLNPHYVERIEANKDRLKQINDIQCLKKIPTKKSK